MKDVNNLIDHLKRIEVYRIPGSDGPMMASVSEETLARTIAGVEHLAAENARLTAIVAELESRDAMPEGFIPVESLIIAHKNERIAELEALVQTQGDEARNKALEEAASVAAVEADEHWEIAGRWSQEGNETAYDRCAARGRTAGRIRDNIRALKDTRHD